MPLSLDVAPCMEARCTDISCSHVPAQDAEGRQLLLLFGGRRDDGLLLNDVWQGELDTSAGNVSIAWTLLSDPQAGVGQGARLLTAAALLGWSALWHHPAAPGQAGTCSCIGRGMQLETHSMALEKCHQYCCPAIASCACRPGAAATSGARGGDVGQPRGPQNGGAWRPQRGGLLHHLRCLAAGPGSLFNTARQRLAHYKGLPTSRCCLFPNAFAQSSLPQVYGSFSDVWVWDPNTTRWQPVAPTTAVQPAPRDHHGGALWAGRLFIFGGRFGELCVGGLLHAAACGACTQAFMPLAALQNVCLADLHAAKRGFPVPSAGTVEEASRPIGDRW